MGLLINPVRKPPLLGATMMAQGIEGCLPLHQGPQGCSAFCKNLLTQHYREVIPLQTTAIGDISTVLGSDDRLESALDLLVEKHDPAVIAVIATSMSAVRGDDLHASVRAWRDGRASAPLVFAVETVDFQGDMETGWDLALAGLLRAFALDAGVECAHRLPVLVGSGLTPGDLLELGALMRAFDVDPLLIPDIGGQLGGGLAEFVSRATGGTSLESLSALASARTALAIGVGDAPVQVLQDRFEVNVQRLERWTGLDATDDLVRWLQEYTGREAPAFVRHQRALLIDAMLDAHFALGGRRAQLAGECRSLIDMGHFLENELGIQVEKLVGPLKSAACSASFGSRYCVGGLHEIAQGGADLVIGPGELRQWARQVRAAWYPWGAPLKETLGQHLRPTLGYSGARELTYALGNLVLEAQT